MEPPLPKPHLPTTAPRSVTILWHAGGMELGKCLSGAAFRTLGPPDVLGQVTDEGVGAAFCSVWGAAAPLDSLH